MVGKTQSVYTLLLWIALCLIAAGCSETQDVSSPAGSSPDAAQSQTDPEIPTVTLPDQEASASGSTATDEGAGP